MHDLYHAGQIRTRRTSWRVSQRASGLSPILRFDHAEIDLIYEPVELETGPNPQMIRFYVECVIPHSSGRITYAADDLFFFPRSFVEFADQLKEVLDGTADEAVLAPPGDELALTIHRVKKELRMQISVNEFKASHSPTTFSGSGWVAMDVAYRWVRELKEEYSQRLNEWLLEQTAG